MDFPWLYYLLATLLVALCALAWSTNLLTLPGNWAVVALAAGFALVYAEGPGEPRGLRWSFVVVNALLAGAGEVIEFLAGAAGAAREGASRRSVALSIVGAIVGSIVGLAAGIPVPVFGPLLGALGGGALGAFLGTYAGEVWIGRSRSESFRAGRGAVVGRLLGTAGKLATGAVQVVLVAFDAYV